VAYFRKDNRVVTVAVGEGTTEVVNLQANGTEPVIMSIDGADVRFSYSKGGPWFTLPDGYQYTWEWKHPWNTEFYLNNNTTTNATVTFMIGGSMYGRNC